MLSLFTLTENGFISIGDILTLIKELTEENERLREDLAKSYEALDEAVNFYCSFTKSKIQNCPIDDEVAKAKTDTVRKMQESLKANERISDKKE